MQFPLRGKAETSIPISTPANKTKKDLIDSFVHDPQPGARQSPLSGGRPKEG